MAPHASYLGHGIALRPAHHDALLKAAAGTVDWVEVTSEDYMDLGGQAVAALEAVRARMPVVLHGKSLSLGSVTPFDGTYLRELRRLIHRIEPVWVSDHLSWGSFGGRYTHQLLPLPYTEEALNHVAERVERVQEILGVPLMLENVASHLLWRASAYTAWDFMAALAQKTGCGLLLDINNVWVDAHNHNVDAEAFLNGMPQASVRQIHLSGFEDRGTHYVDTHDCAVAEPVWDLYRRAVQKFGKLSTLVEWEENLPSFETLVEEVDRARAVEGAALLNPRPHRQALPVELATQTQPTAHSLNDCQRLFCEYILQPEALKYSQALAELFIEPQRADVGLYLRTYHDRYWTGVLEAMRADFPLTRRWLGDKVFEAQARAYLQAHPSGHYNIMRAGSHFAPSLRRRDVVASQLAAVEWAGLHVSTRSMDASASIDVLRTLTPDLAMTARMQLVAQLTWVELECDIDTVLHRLILKEQTDDINVSMKEGSLMALWRNGQWLERTSIPPHEFVALERVRAGATLSQVCDLLSEHARTFHGEAPAVVLHRWFTRGWIAGFG